MQQLIQLRWLAVFGQLVTIAAAHYVYGIGLPLVPMLWTLVVQVGFNALSAAGLRLRHDVRNGELFVALLVDVAVLTVQLSFSGGSTNPFVFLYLLQVILGAVLLQPRYTWALVAITGACLAGQALYADPLALPPDHDRGIASPYIQGMLVCFMLNAGLLVFFITRISANLRARDERLAALRQRAAEEEHIVRMGLLASGAAHELGTPLATMSVIVGDWRRMPALQREPELLQEVNEIEAQLARCKSIVTGILLSAGETRGESTGETTLAAFLQDLVDDWRATRPSANLVYRNDAEPDVAVVADSALKQTIGNLLDNAAEASPQSIALQATRDGDTLVLTVNDTGPGFTPEMLAQFGKPYQSSKGRPGGGLGLFLVVNVARTLGGTVEPHNLHGSGASVTLRLPLAAIALDDELRGGQHGAASGTPR